MLHCDLRIFLQATDPLSASFDAGGFNVSAYPGDGSCVITIDKERKMSPSDILIPESFK